MEMVEFCARLAFAELRASADRRVFWFFPASSAAKTNKLTRAIGVFQCLAYGMLVRVDAIKSSLSRYTYLTKP